MRFATVNGERREAEKRLVGMCIGCEQPMIPKCGQVKVKHWAHKSQCECDHWWEPETLWHRTWKSHFPVQWQEIVHASTSGEKHIADVKTANGWVLEFQHSNINSDERKSRNSFYPKLAWVVDGVRRKRDQAQFLKSLRMVKAINSPIVGRFCAVDFGEGALLRDWENDTTPIFFDFGEPAALWCLLPRNSEGKSYVLEFSRVAFIQFHQHESPEKDLFAELINGLRAGASEHASQLRQQERRLTAQAAPNRLFRQHRFQINRSRRF